MATTDFASDASNSTSNVSNFNATTSASNASNEEGRKELEEEPHMPKYELLKNAISARNKAKFDELGIVDLVKFVRGKEGADNNVGNTTTVLGKQKIGAHGRSGIVDDNGSRLKAPWKKVQPLSMYALPPPKLSD